MISQEEFRAAIESRFNMELTNSQFESFLDRVPLDVEGNVLYTRFMQQFDARSVKRDRIELELQLTFRLGPCLAGHYLQKWRMGGTCNNNPIKRSREREKYAARIHLQKWIMGGTCDNNPIKRSREREKYAARIHLQKWRMGGTCDKNHIFDRRVEDPDRRSCRRISELHLCCINLAL